MMYNYVKLADDTQIAYSDIQKDNTVQIAVERPVDGGFDTALCLLPSYRWTKVEGFSREDIEEITELLKNNAPLIFRLSREATKTYA